METPIELREVSPEPMTLDDLNLIAKEKGVPNYMPHKRNPILSKILYYLLKVQKYSAYTFSSFLGLHLTSVVIVPGLGVPMPLAQEIFEMSRAVYQSIPHFENLIIIGSSICHVCSGIGIRLIRSRLKEGEKHRSKLVYEPVIKNDERDDIGLGGITGLIGLGYRKSMISRLIPGLSPLSFSGYLLLPLIGYHFTKFRQIPSVIDGDSSLINLDYITYYLNKSRLEKIGNVINYVALMGLVVIGSYHFVSGYLKLNHKYSLNYKKIGYTFIGGLSILGCISLIRFKSLPLVEGFIGKSFTNYVNYLAV
ncbi:DEHA2G23980p [Debaryomyces hansenii CBS767]|uniref:DEHA2G23980p n=1 Tax=Debaryomyces hansenii (strain ATCC 36239 / CBS 767 / BCRC 21394 / JCM 1990 / NBRC 0083 / IGC 2968) TaxID=284592 RepID=Q6BGT9_DEBHA|nr:DEHA2G23980p [Debaryomyces hansenii CBS767]CAG91095.2 DEHA2G23980p [Debaryomyces hansenii CBS767]|eukprot:XP_462582.2 DEHA2G23980p [Debaryomyces hansenii CBS767]